MSGSSEAAVRSGIKVQEHRNELKRGEGHVRLAAASPRAGALCPAHHIPWAGTLTQYLQFAKTRGQRASVLCCPALRSQHHSPVSLPTRTLLLLAAPCVHRSLHYRSCGQDIRLTALYWHALSYCTQLLDGCGRTAGAQLRNEMTVPEPTLVTSKPEASQGRADATCT